MNEAERDALLGDLLARVHALRDITVCLLALRARDAAEPAAVLREVSESLSQRLDRLPAAGTAGGARDADIRIGIAKIQGEIDAIIADAWAALGLGDPHP